METCNTCKSELINATVNGRHVKICENCLRKQGHIINIDMSKCEFCDMWFHRDVEKKCQCRQLDMVIL